MKRFHLPSGQAATVDDGYQSITFEGTDATVERRDVVALAAILLGDVCPVCLAPRNARPYICQPFSDRFVCGHAGLD